MRTRHIVFVAALLIVLQANAYFLLSPLAPLGFSPNFPLPFVVFLAVRDHSLRRGAITSFCVGYATDLLAVAPIGLFSFTYVGVFLLARAAGLRLAAQGFIAQLILGFGFSLLTGLMVAVLLAIFGKDAWIPVRLLALLPASCISTAIVTPLVFRFAGRVMGSQDVRATFGRTAKRLRLGDAS